MSIVSRLFLRRSINLMLQRGAHVKSARELTGFEKIKFDQAGFQKYGLLADDLLDENDDDVAEAVRRLPDNLLMARIHRAIRAQQAEVMKSILPKEQWTTYDDDHYYLQDLLDEVIKEREEMEEWEATH